MWWNCFNNSYAYFGLLVVNGKETLSDRFDEFNFLALDREILEC
jgi:hypothetical protein